MERSQPSLTIILVAAVAALALIALGRTYANKRSPNNLNTFGLYSAAVQSEVKELTDKSDIKAEVEDSDIPVVIDFSATWCGPCQRLAPRVEQLATEYKGRVKVFKVDIDKSPQLKAKFGVTRYPTVFYIKPKNAERTSSIGELTYDGLKQLTEWALKK